ncbi:uncharacterized protein BT62DRAFT_1007583 [Guyanagaster necrorhizus]|uniref:Uncharacterized protein n=1 Tax=Guyanagaster necrorhizus TaxID=856835 RepID=A0A9P7VQH8_9AGAR|nr:uncharacterized protein BT62DRAFT_1007583 [Guyanagaster necrorhizus MCA 3950]KAG7444585.1 hypothetical protein BT62DRAFT_1007583 [Guyanagaster necrorhizus MCA 3950]
MPTPNQNSEKNSSEAEIALLTQKLATLTAGRDELGGGSEANESSSDRAAQTPELWSSLHLVIPRSGRFHIPDSQPELYEQMRTGFEYWLEHPGGLPLDLSLRSEEGREDESHVGWVFERGPDGSIAQCTSPSFSLGVFSDLPGDLLESLYPVLSASTAPAERAENHVLLGLAGGSFPRAPRGYNESHPPATRALGYQQPPEMFTVLGACTHCRISTTERFHPQPDAHPKSSRGMRAPPAPGDNKAEVPELTPTSSRTLVAPALEVVDGDGLQP